MPITFGSTRVRRGAVWVPQDIFKPQVKVTIVDNSGTTLTVTNDCTRWTVEGLRNGLKSAEIYLDNISGKYSNSFGKGKALKVYADYIDASQLIFSGKIDELYYGLSDSDGWHLEVHARQLPELADKTIIQSFTDSTASDAITSIIDNNFSGIVDYAQLGTINTTVTFNFQHQTGLEAIKQILDSVGYEFFFNENNQIIAFASNTRKNNNETISFGTNLSRCNEAGYNYSNEKNRVIVYGGNADKSNNVTFISTSEDTTLQNSSWVSDEIINDTSNLSQEETDDIASTALNNKKIAPLQARMEVVGGLLTINGGEIMTCTIPYCNISGDYKVYNYVHTWSGDGLNSTISIGNEYTHLRQIIKERVDNEAGLRTFQNTNFMKQTKIFTYDNTTGTESSTSIDINAGKMSLTSGQTTGIWTSNTFTMPSFRYIEVRIFSDGDGVGAGSIQISNDDGTTYITAGLNSQIDLSSSNTKLKIKVTLISNTTYPNPVIDALGVMTKA